MLRGWDDLFALEPEAALPLLERCASNERERYAVRAFTPLLASGLLQLIDRTGADHDAHCGAISRQVTIRADQLAEIAAGLRSSLIQVARPMPAALIEQLAMAGASRSSAPADHNPYNGKIWMGLLALGGLALAGATLLAFGVGNRLAERRGVHSAVPPQSAAPPAPAVPAPPVASGSSSPAGTAQMPAAQPAPPSAEPAAPSPEAAAPPSEPADAAGNGSTDSAETNATPVRWRACEALPAAVAATGQWALLAPMSALRDVRLHCLPDARAHGQGVLLARIDQRAQAEQLAAALSSESGQPILITRLSAP
ncbi:MAG: hypothetical protein ACKO6F_11395 [Cyanobium sp.]